MRPNKLDLRINTSDENIAKERVNASERSLKRIQYKRCQKTAYVFISRGTTGLLLVVVLTCCHHLSGKKLTKLYLFLGIALFKDPKKKILEESTHTKNRRKKHVRYGGDFLSFFRTYSQESWVDHHRISKRTQHPSHNLKSHPAPAEHNTHK